MQEQVPYMFKYNDLILGRRTNSASFQAPGHHLLPYSSSARRALSSVTKRKEFSTAHVKIRLLKQSLCEMYLTSSLAAIHRRNSLSF